jgi:hypothetical protein
MASQVSPGVVIKERDLSNAVVVGALQITAAFASSFRTGPVGKITTIGSERELIDTFGEPAEANAEDWLIAAEYLKYGGTLAVVRAATGVNNATASGTGVLVASKDAFDAGVSTEKLLARYAGTTGNNYKVVIVDRGADQIATVATHGLAVGATYTDSASKTHTVYEVIDANTIAIINTGGFAVSGVTAIPWYSNTEIGSTGIKLSAIGPRPGTSAYAAERYISYDEVHVAVVDETSNTIIERFTYLSKLSDGKSAQGASSYWRDVVNLSSSFIYSGAELATGDLQTSGSAWGATAASYGATALAPVKLKIGKTRSFDLSGGTDDYAYTTGEIQAAYNQFLDTEQSTVDFVLMGGSMSTEADTKSKAEAVVGVATSRKDCVAFVSPFKGNQIATSGGVALTTTAQRDNTIAFLGALPSTSYAVLDSGIKYTYDRFADKYRYIGCNGDIAGLCVRTSATLDDWFSPAGLNRGAIRGVVKLAYNPNKADRDELYQNRINPVVSFPGQGTVLFGDKTALASPSAFDRINVRRLFLNVEKRAEQLAKTVLFEQNDFTTRSGFSASINSYLSEIQARRGLTDFLVVCDESNNTPEVIDRNEFIAELYLKPTRSINYVTVTVTATKTGVSFAEVIGR